MISGLIFVIQILQREKTTIVTRRRFSMQYTVSYHVENNIRCHNFEDDIRLIRKSESAFIIPSLGAMPVDFFSSVKSVFPTF